MAAEPHPLPTLADLQSAIEDALPAQLPSASPIAQPLADAMRYAVLGGGKRLRAMLACAACLSLGGRLENALAPACALECMHAYSLVHDDLPAMDDDALRRGRPSCHIAYGVATAILAGDALQALAFEILAKAPKASAEVRLAAIRALGDACGWSGMAGGQAFDLASEGERLSLPQLQALHAAKTGALMQAAVGDRRPVRRRGRASLGPAARLRKPHRGWRFRSSTTCWITPKSQRHPGQAGRFRSAGGEKHFCPSDGRSASPRPCATAARRGPRPAGQGAPAR